ncbi:unnamed protein product [Cuscuta campestris]|uniref:Aminotransferase-like plant mobile domain-containing protein n=1 Tax=Cuscuta campestris TaxID=132261 RepID=A0A484MT63_9ASTE|nr:unnamed protein product [Cuscuta campestris]
MGDTNLVPGRAIGSAVLSFLYRSMCRASMTHAAQIGGCLVLLQLWAWERLPVTRPRGVVPLEQLVNVPYTLYCMADCHQRLDPVYNPGHIRRRVDRRRNAAAVGGRYCLRHLRSNFWNKFRRKKLRTLMYKAGEAPSRSEFDHLLLQVASKNQEAYNWLNAIPKYIWALSQDKGGAPYGIMTTNSSESFNNILKGCRCWPVYAIMKFTYDKLVKVFAKRRTNGYYIRIGRPMASILDKIIMTMDDILDKLLGLLKNIFYGRVEFQDGACIAYDHVDEILKTFHLFRHLLDLPYSDSELYAFNVEISCSIQDLVRGTPMALSDISLELKSFKIRMMNAIRNLLGIPIAPPDLVPTTTLHNPTSTDVERTIGDSVRVPAVDAGGVSVEGIVNAY